MSLFQPAPEPVSELARYRILSSTAGIRVSPFQLGAMSIGDAWSSVMGGMTKEQAFTLLDAYFEAGGNFIDTANDYQCGQSETWLGEWMAARRNREQVVIATKFTNAYTAPILGNTGRAVNHGGNHKRSLHVSLHDSLKKLQTAWIDILYLHWWDHTTSIEEIMDSLHNLLQQGRVLYLGISDTPAWIVSAANTYARDHGKTPFSIYQGRWNVLLRDFERDILPMARHFGMALAPWDERGESLRSTFGSEQSEDEVRMSEALAKVSAEHEVESVTAIALAYVMSKAPNVFPLVGGRKVEHLQDNIAALKIRLTTEKISYLESVRPFDIGFPGNMIGEDPKVSGKTPLLLAPTASFAFVQSPRAIGYEGGDVVSHQ
ncbi:NADP-dependent oxidoreductase domain-containing protein [Aspergillus carlsbadensis]|nr:NADP-dependent oxidoreductase domain-containing protein [Aspergillus carlsbadensis]